MYEYFKVNSWKYDIYDAFFFILKTFLSRNIGICGKCFWKDVHVNVFETRLLVMNKRSKQISYLVHREFELLFCMILQIILVNIEN